MRVFVSEESTEESKRRRLRASKRDVGKDEQYSERREQKVGSLANVYVCVPGPSLS